MGRAPGFTIPLTVKHAKPGDRVVFECLPYGKPFPEIKWLKDGMALSPGEGLKIEADPDGTQRSLLENVDFPSEGFFRCVATNEVKILILNFLIFWFFIFILNNFI